MNVSILRSNYFFSEGGQTKKVRLIVFSENIMLLMYERLEHNNATLNVIHSVNHEVTFKYTGCG